jgi:hypothetical protein
VSSFLAPPGSRPPPSPPPRPLNAKNAARRIGCSERQLRRFAEQGLIVGAYRVGPARTSHWAFPIASVEAYIAARVEEARSAVAAMSAATENQDVPTRSALAAAQK